MMRWGFQPRRSLSVRGLVKEGSNGPTTTSSPPEVKDANAPFLLSKRMRNPFPVITIWGSSSRVVNAGSFPCCILPLARPVMGNWQAATTKPAGAQGTASFRRKRSSAWYSFPLFRAGTRAEMSMTESAPAATCISGSFKVAISKPFSLKVNMTSYPARDFTA